MRPNRPTVRYAPLVRRSAYAQPFEDKPQLIPVFRQRRQIRELISQHTNPVNLHLRSQILSFQVGQGKYRQIFVAAFLHVQFRDLISVNDLLMPPEQIYDVVEIPGQAPVPSALTFSAKISSRL